MKKIIISIFVLLVLLWSVDLVFARRGGQSGGASRQNRPQPKVQSRSSSRQTRETAEKQAGKSKGEIEREIERTRASKGQAGTAEKRAGKLQGKALQKEASKGKGKTAEKIAKGKGQQQQMKTLQKQLIYEEAKYQQRKARIERIRKLATKKGNKNILARLDKLEAKERKRYGSKWNRVLERIRTMQQEGEKAQGKALQKTVEKSATKEKAKAQQVGTKVEQKTK